MTKWIAGPIAGLAATAPMTLVMTVLHRRLPRREQYPLPPYEITTELAEKAGVENRLDENERQGITLVAHFSYGAAMGALYTPFAAGLKAKRMPPIAGGILFGLMVWGGSYLGMLPALHILRPATEHPLRRNALMITAHIVWGAVLDMLVDRLSDTEESDSQG